MVWLWWWHTFFNVFRLFADGGKQYGLTLRPAGHAVKLCLLALGTTPRTCGNIMSVHECTNYFIAHMATVHVPHHACHSHAHTGKKIRHL